MNFSKYYSKLRKSLKNTFTICKFPLFLVDTTTQFCTQINKIKTMKKMRLLFLVCITLISSNLTAQYDAVAKQSIAVVDFDVRGYKMNQIQAIQFLTNELIRVGYFEVMDKYDIEYIARRDSLDLLNCYSKICLQEVGKKLKVDKMLSGSISQMGDNLNISLRILDVNKGNFETQKVREFLVIPGTEFQMLRICVNDLFNVPNDNELVTKLTKRADFDNAINNPYAPRLQSDGPRMGATFMTGYLGTLMTRSENAGGYNGNPFMFQFGYQFEKQYLNEGNFQALFEFIPMITGLDQGRVIPSITLLNGLRNNVNGWEFAFGPNFAISRSAEGFFPGNDQSQNFVLGAPGPNQSGDIITAPDSRGTTVIATGFLFAAGKTFKSGKLNIPVNVFAVPGKWGWRFGISMGWNAKDRYERN